MQIDAYPNVSVANISVTGQQYGLDTVKTGSNTEIIFAPYNATTYTLAIGFAGNSSYYITIAKLSTPGVRTQLNNLTIPAGQPSELVVTVLVSPNAATPTQSPWDPFFGLTGFRIGGINISFANFVEALFGASAILIGLGLYFKSKISYLGGILLVFVLIVLVGFLPLIAFGFLYLIGYGIVHLAWRIRHHTSKGGPT